MARIRSIHPEQWVDEEFATGSPLARLVAIGVRNFADDNGVFEWKPLKLKMQILPADNCDMAALLGELVASGQIKRYEVDGRAYGIIRNFTKYQRPKKPMAWYPLPSEPVGNEFGTAHVQNTPKSRTGSPPVRNQYGNSTSDGEKDGEGEKEKPPLPPKQIITDLVNGQLIVMVGNRVLELLGHDPAAFTGNFSLVEHWLKSGCDPDKHIYPTVERMAKRNTGRPKPLAYFSQAVLECKDLDIPGFLKRELLASINPVTGEPDPPHVKRYLAAYRMWVESGRQGPSPTQDQYPPV